MARCAMRSRNYLPTTPAIFVVQHMPANFTKAFAQRLNEICSMEVREAMDGDAAIPGVVLITPGSPRVIIISRSDAAARSTTSY